MLKHICEIISPLNGLSIKNIISNAKTREIETPNLEWLSLMS